MNSLSLVGAVAVGGSIGAVARYFLVGLIAGRYPSVIPLGTLTVNAVGALLVGILFVVLTEKLALPSHWRFLLITGFLGAFTTFSAFSLELVEMLMAGDTLNAVLYLLASVVLCVSLAACGIGLGRLL